jgi:tRNA nucleotidyltransferase (CCA-adding enzyme)
LTALLKEICVDVLKRVTPTSWERKHILALARKLMEKVAVTAKEASVDAEVRIEGSVAKDTWLSEEPEIDIFMRVPTNVPREAFETTYLEIAKKATKGYEQIERFAEHPYLEAVIDDIKVNIVPCYRVKSGEWISATDRTPFHTNYVKRSLDERLCGEVRLLKKFMKGIRVYGAEIKVGGLSGYLCELLVLNYGSFVKVLSSVANWKEKMIIDYEGYYKGREQDVEKIFEEPLVVVDPVDRGRNAAAAVRKEKMNEFTVAARAFLKDPHLKFFYPQEVKALNPEKLVQSLKTRGSTIIFVRFGRVKAVPDVLWGQLYKSQRSLRRMLQQHDFNILRDAAWSNEENLNLLIFEVESRFLIPIKKHLGPPVRKKVECEKFLRKHLEVTHTVSGPRVEGGRWVVEIKRKHMDMVDLLFEKLGDGGRRIGVADMISKTVADSVEILVNTEVLGLYSSDPQFAKFLTEYLEGKPSWLT